MSKYKTIQTEFKDIESLKKALADTGFPVFSLSLGPRENTLTLKDYYERENTQKVALKIGKDHSHGYEDVGFFWDGKSYQAIISSHDGNGNIGEQTLKRITQRYAYHEVVKKAHAKGYTINESKQPGGGHPVTTGEEVDMSGKHELIIDITPDGKVIGEVKGVEGASCAPLSEWLDELGAVLEDRKTPDYHKRAKQTVKTR